MKTLLLGMLFSASIGPLILLEVEPDSQWARDFSWSMIGGTGGMLLCLVMWETNNIKVMARDAIGNLMTAACFGPAVSYWVARLLVINITPQLLVAVAAILGLCGVSLVRAAKPIWMKLWTAWNERKASQLGGE